ncbi:ABC transporter permease [Catellatospora sp. KI3]|uniref:ABC transporter permease n=1 Tax=Catellatospora sp. KI3 TaxID=3041620 RepID=UPI0024825279|nr:ABC transporter permease [Catellatospora sp. KI3]MDI1464277.1 ABC transporter permease [Catellatospora sp. KI3]
MVNYIIRRLFGGAIMLFAVSIATFLIFFGLPRLAGATPESFAARYVGPRATAEVQAQAAEKLGLNDPLYEQYGRWVKAIFVGADYDYGPAVEHCPAPCFGYSFITKRPVFDDLLDRLPVTASLALGAAVIWLLAGVATGVLSALRRGSLFDRFAMGTALAGVSLPIFFTGTLALSIFSYGRPFDWTARGSSYTPITEDPGMWAYNLILPWITLAFLYAAAYARNTRAGMLETMGEDYIRTARAKGLRERTVVVKHGLRGALTPIITIFGLDLGLLLGGAVLTETTFSLQGIGKFTIEAINKGDFPRIMGVTMLAAFFIVIANLVVDLLYAVVDPRVRLS